jgi:hypothetical protein
MGGKHTGLTSAPHSVPARTTVAPCYQYQVHLSLPQFGIGHRARPGHVQETASSAVATSSWSLDKFVGFEVVPPRI